MKNVRVARFADDWPIPDLDPPEDRVVELPLSDDTTELGLLVFFEDRSRGARVRNYHVLPDNELQCFVDRPASPAEIEHLKRFRLFDEFDSATIETIWEPE